MCKWWIIFFILGSFLSKYSSNIYLYTSVYSSYILFTYIIFITIFIIINKFYNKKNLSILKTLTILVATIWGTSHSSPRINHSIKEVQIIKASVGFGSLIIKDEKTNTFYETVGTYKGNLSGSIRCYQNKSNIFSTNHCMFINSERYDYSDNNLLSNISSKVKDYLYKNINSRSYLSRFKGFISGIVYGDKSQISYFNKELFKRLGIYHLLVISGLHFSLFAFFIREGIFCFIKTFYILKIISPLSWIKLSIIFDVMICIILLIFSYIVGLSSATQRALLIFIVHSLTPYICGRLPLSKTIPLTLSLQTLLFPLGFISVATAISWICYLFFVDFANSLNSYKYTCENSYRTTYSYNLYNSSYIFYLLKRLKIKSKFFIFRSIILFYTQIKLMILTYLGFSQLSLISCFTNIILVPIFPIVLFISLYFSTTPENYLDSYLYNIFILFFSIIDKFYSLEQNVSNYIDINHISNLKSFIILSFILSIIWIWNLYKKIFIPKKIYLSLNSTSSNEE